MKRTSRLRWIPACLSPVSARGINGGYMKNILLLEDDENLNRGISLKLFKEGYHVFSAYTILEAKSIFDKEDIALVISDISLPDGSGLDFGKVIREKSNAVLIYLTAMEQEIDIVNGYDTGADDYITKPFSVNILTSKVNAFMRRLGNQEEGVYIFYLLLQISIDLQKWKMS